MVRVSNVATQPAGHRWIVFNRSIRARFLSNDNRKSKDPDAAIYRSASRAKTRTQSSEHGFVATGKHGGLSGCSCVERHIRLLRGPDAMEQHGQLTGYRDDSCHAALKSRIGCPYSSALSVISLQSHCTEIADVCTQISANVHDKFRPRFECKSGNNGR